MSAAAKQAAVTRLLLDLSAHGMRCLGEGDRRITYLSTAGSGLGMGRVFRQAVEPCDPQLTPREGSGIALQRLQDVWVVKVEGGGVCGLSE